MSPPRPPMVADELTWELVRDEWELLLAVGSGPTSVAAAAAALALGAPAVGRRLALLERHGLVRRVPAGAGPEELAYGLVPAFYERREGMSSYLRDLVLRRLQDGDAPPIAGLVRTDLGSAEALAAVLATAEERLYPAVVDAASRPESDRSERFSVFFAAAADCPIVHAADKDLFLSELLCVLRAAAAQRTQDAETRSAYLWIAEMRVDPEVAADIGDLFESFLTPLPALPGQGAAGFAIVPSARVAPRRGDVTDA
ncbi:MAG: MarR family transcriptional regulator [Deltaproteobacteria bacterium]|nr:MarR family transcriptional regulator [Deltaproteobacteria bacterium]